MLQGCLSQYRDRYHDSLNQEAALSIRAALRRELKPVVIDTEAALETMVTSTGLPAELESNDTPALPFPAPFSSALPGVRPLPAAVHLLQLPSLRLMLQELRPIHSRTAKRPARHVPLLEQLQEQKVMTAGRL